MIRTGTLMALTFANSACRDGGGDPVFPRILTTEVAIYDAGVVAVNDQKTLTVNLGSIGGAPVVVWDVHLEDEEDTNWEVSDTWANTTVTLADNEEIPALEVDAGTSAPVQLAFHPTDEGNHAATLIVESNDSTATEEDPDTGNKLLRVPLLGTAHNACGAFDPDAYDFGSVAPGERAAATFLVESCADVPLTVSGYAITGETDFSLATILPSYVLDGEPLPLVIRWTPTTADPAQATLTLVTNAPDPQPTLTLAGNDG